MLPEEKTVLKESGILTITLNPAIDKNFTVQRLEPDHKLRCPNPRVDAGGGGINVSKGIHKLGGMSLAVTLTAGRNGQYFQDLVRREGVDMMAIEVEGETRENIVISEESTKRQYRIVAEGPILDPVRSMKLIEGIRNLEHRPAFIVASGSLPRGLPDDFFAKIAAVSKEIGAKCILDTSGEPLRYALREGVYLAKPNLKELADLSGRETLVLDEVDDAAREIILKGYCELVVVSLGPDGAMMVDRNGYERVPAPMVERKSTVGAGDSLVAGMVWALQQGLPLPGILRMGVACGSAATMNEGTQLFRKEDAEKLYQWLTRVHPPVVHKHGD